MTQLETLIQTLCPNGVKFVKLGEVVAYEQPSKYIVKSTEYDDSYDIPVLTAGQSFILGYTNEKEGIYHASPSCPVVIFDDFTTSMQWVDFPFKVKSSAMKILTSRDNETALIRYLYFALKTIKYTPDTATHARQWIGTYAELQIPLPPLAVQSEIVRVLDKFTLHKAELAAELAARLRQYEYYRDKLLTFDDTVKRVKLGEVGEFIRGNGLQKKDFVDEGFPCIHYGQIHTYYGTFTTKTKSFVADPLYSKLKKAQTGDLIIATTSEDAEGVCKAVAWLGKEDVAVSGDAYIFRHSQNPKYMAYLFQTEQFLKYKKKAATGTKVVRVSGESMAKFEFAIPSLEVQERIVSILDRFDKLCHDIREGLPAEIELRQKQYEHYRDRLLTFRQLGD